MKIPDGYLTRARAEHLTEVLIAGIREITGRLAIRAAERCAGTDEAKVRAILEEEAQRAIGELEAVHADVRAQASACEH